MNTIEPHQQQDQFDLLPFIAILMVLMDALLLVTLGVAALSLGAGVAEGWDLGVGGDAQRKAPVLIEWDGEFATVHSGRTKRQVRWAQPAAGDGEPTRTAEMTRLLDQFAASRDAQYAVFAVRPSGFRNFESMADDFRNRGVDIGFEPIPQERALRDLSRTLAP